jgi:7-cyano-7-deazaguanine tRNA-ribosyltransferase
MQIIAGVSLRSLNPRVWESDSEYYLPDLTAIIISYADFHQSASARIKAMERGLHDYLNVPAHIKIYLDNGAFYFLSHVGQTPVNQYIEFVRESRPDWFPIPQDFIPTPRMSLEEQRQCFQNTMEFNHNFAAGDYVPVLHISPQLTEYTTAISQNPLLVTKQTLAIGGIVPNLLRSPKAISHRSIISSLQHVRQQFVDHDLHVFGIGGTATIHLGMLLSLDSADSCGWRNRAARGIVQLPGSGDRSVADLGSWRGREPSQAEWEILEQCQCSACRLYGRAGLQAEKVQGFRNRATHNLWVLLQEINWIKPHLETGTYAENYQARLNNSHYLPLIREILELMETEPDLI